MWRTLILLGLLAASVATWLDVYLWVRVGQYVGYMQQLFHEAPPEPRPAFGEIHELRGRGGVLRYITFTQWLRCQAPIIFFFLYGAALLMLEVLPSPKKSTP